MCRLKKYFAFLMIVFILCSGSALAVNAEYTFGNYKYTIYDDGALILSYSGAEESVSVPATVPNHENNGDIAVYAIGEEAFLGNQTLKSIELPDSVTIIEREAFSGCKNLSSISFGSGIKKIGNSSFTFCTSLKSITIPDTVTEVQNGAFQYSGLERVTFGSGIKNIADGTFRGCSSLARVILGANVESIGKLAFGFCSSLDTVNIHDKVTSIAPDAFDSDFAGIIYGYPDSFAKTFASGKNFDFQTFSYNALEITALPEKLIYLVGTELDATGLAVSATYADAPKRDVTEKCTVTSEPFSDIGKKSVTVSYTESGYSKEISFDVEVVADPVESIEIITNPSKNVYRYRYRHNIDLTGTVISVTYSSGAVNQVTDTSKMSVSGFDSKKIGEQTLELIFEEKTAEIKVTVKYEWWQWLIRILLFGWIWY